MYKVVLRSDVEKFLHKKVSQQFRHKLATKIDTLQQDPFAPNPNAAKMKGGSPSYRLRIGDYRVIYEVDSKTQTIIIWKIDHRSSIYKI